MKPSFLLLAAAALLVVSGGIGMAQQQSKKDSSPADKIQPLDYDDGTIPYVAGDNPMGWNIPYSFSQDNTYPSYAIARKAMAPTFKESISPAYANNVIGMAEIDLNYDKHTEIIAFPVENEEEAGLLCNVNRLCPHYVIEVQGNKAAILGVLYGYKVNRGDNIKNKYLTLKVYTDPAKENYFEEYAYNPKKNEYELVAR